jgi:O-antigen/teichoic acid export membrane protein
MGSQATSGGPRPAAALYSPRIEPAASNVRQLLTAPRAVIARLAQAEGAFVAIALTGVVTQLVTALSGPFAARMLGPHARGQMVLVVIVASICCQFAIGGLPAAVSHVVAQSDLPARDVIRSQSRRWKIGSLIPGLVAAALAGLVLHARTPHWPGLALLAAALAVSTTWQYVLYGMLQGERRIARIVIFHLFGLVLNSIIVITIYLASPTHDPRVLLAVFVGCVIVGLQLGFLMLRRRSPEPPVVDDAGLRAFARRGYLSGVGLMDLLGLDLLLVGVFLGDVRLSLYQVAVSATTLPLIVLATLAAVLLPRMSAATSPAAAVAVRRRWVWGSAGLALLIVLALEAVVAPVLSFAFGPQFTGAIGCARITAVSAALLGMRRVLTAVAQAQGRVAYASAVEAVGVVLLVGGVIGLGLAFGIHGAAFAVAGAALVSSLALAVGIYARPPRVEGVTAPEAAA